MTELMITVWLLAVDSWQLAVGDWGLGIISRCLEWQNGVMCWSWFLEAADMHKRSERGLRNVKVDLHRPSQPLVVIDLETVC